MQGFMGERPSKIVSLIGCSECQQRLFDLKKAKPRRAGPGALVQ
jgi:hypothetical protein